MRPIPLVIVLCLTLCACARITPYRLDIQQGNVVSAEAVGKLKPGMTRPQVTFLLGTPLLRDAFHADRWDYPYYIRKRDRMVEQSHVIAIFENDRLRRIEGPPELVDASVIAAFNAPPAAPAPPEAPAAGAAQQAAPAGPPAEKAR